MWTKRAIAVLVAVVMAICVIPVSDASAESSVQETLVDAGYVESSESFFYYAKFGISGFPLTGGSVSGDDPAKGVGKTIHDNTIFASFSNMSVEKNYVLSIKEIVGTSTKASVLVDLGSDTVNKTAWISIDAADKAYVNGIETEMRVVSGPLGQITESTSLEFSLIDAGNRALDQIPANASAILSCHVDDLMDHTIILDSYITENSGNSNAIEDLGKNYGWGGSKKQYAGDKIGAPIGNYVCIFFMTNVDSPVIKVTQGKDVYEVPTENIFFNTGSTDSGYGYAYLCIDDLEGFDKENGLDSVSIYNGDKLCASYVAPVEEVEGVGPVICIGAIIIAALVVLIYVVLNKKGGM